MERRRAQRVIDAEALAEALVDKEGGDGDGRDDPEHGPDRHDGAAAAHGDHAGEHTVDGLCKGGAHFGQN